MFAAVLVLSVLASVDARADVGVVITRAALGAADRQSLEKAVATDRAAHPAAFRAVEDVRASVKGLDESKRGRLAAVGPRLKALGRDALLPMLALLALEAAREDAVPSARRALRVGLLEAVGALRDPRAEAVLVAAAKADHADAHVAAAAARALGRLGSTSSVATLKALAAGDAGHRLAAAAGLGECRRAASVAVLRALSTDAVDDVRLAAVRGLGAVGNAQAWKTSGMVRTEEAATRQAAAQALVALFVAGDEPARRLSAEGILLVDDPGTPALIEAAKAGADDQTVTALTALTERFAKNPTR